LNGATTQKIRIHHENLTRENEKLARQLHQRDRQQQQGLPSGKRVYLVEDDPPRQQAQPLLLLCGQGGIVILPSRQYLVADLRSARRQRRHRPHSAAFQRVQYSRCLPAQYLEANRLHPRLQPALRRSDRQGRPATGQRLRRKNHRLGRGILLQHPLRNRREDSRDRYLVPNSLCQSHNLRSPRYICARIDEPDNPCVSGQLPHNLNRNVSFSSFDHHRQCRAVRHCAIEAQHLLRRTAAPQHGRHRNQHSVELKTSRTLDQLDRPHDGVARYARHQHLLPCGCLGNRPHRLPRLRIRQQRRLPGPRQHHQSRGGSLRVPRHIVLQLVRIQSAVGAERCR